MAIESSGRCLDDATFEVVSGQGPIGDVIRQETPCDVWSYGGGVNLTHLTIGVAVSLRASAPGYSTVEKSLFPKTAGMVDEFVLDRSRDQ